MGAAHAAPIENKRRNPRGKPTSASANLVRGFCTEDTGHHAWMFLSRLFRPFGPLGLAFMAYRLWRRLSPQQKAALKERVRRLTTRMRGAPAR